MANRFVITQDLFETWCKKGYSVQEMADEATRISGVKCTPGRIRQGAKVFGISLREKPKNNPFEFRRREDNVVATPDTQEVTAETPVTEQAVVAETTQVVEQPVFNLQ